MATSDDSPFALVVDDDVLIRINACDILTEAGFRPLEAGNVDEAMTILEERGEDVVLLFTDVQMPGGRDGFQLAAEAARRWPELGILVASGDARPKPDDMPDGAVFIEKPFSADVVHHRVQEILPEGRKPEPLKRKAATA